MQHGRLLGCILLMCLLVRKWECKFVLLRMPGKVGHVHLRDVWWRVLGLELLAGRHVLSCADREGAIIDVVAVVLVFAVEDDAAGVVAGSTLEALWGKVGAVVRGASGAVGALGAIAAIA